MGRLSNDEKFNGRFAIRHAGLTVIPQRGKQRIPFQTRNDAAEWAKKNYRGDNWEVIRLALDWRKTRNCSVPNGDRT